MSDAVAKFRVAAMGIARPNGLHRAAVATVAFSQLFLLGIALTRKFIGQLTRLGIKLVNTRQLTVKSVASMTDHACQEFFDNAT